MNRVFSIFVFIIIVFNIYASEWESLIPNLTDEDRVNISNGKYGDRPRVNYRDGLELIPSSIVYQNELLTSLSEYDPELCVEMLFVLDKPNVNDDELMVYLLNHFRAFSAQEGLEYYSANRKGMYPLIKKSYYVDDKKKKVEDPVVKFLPAYEEHTYFQNDSAFSSNYYSLTTQTNNDNLWIRMENLDSLRVMGLVKALDAGEQRVDIFLDVVDENIIIYTLAQIKKEPEIKQVLKWKVNVPGSFKRRMRTIVDWYRERIRK